ncbi:MAG: hypothetical protein LBS60_09515 [Deltaproteobacteria bacterium]|jgi:hypothetical protein|nr:hypothetical protein [Deltaproteobacteria bacterium]
MEKKTIIICNQNITTDYLIKIADIALDYTDLSNLKIKLKKSTITDNQLSSTDNSSINTITHNTTNLFSNLPDPTPVNTTPVNTTPLNQTPAPVKTEPVKTKSAKTKPAKTKPAKTEPVKTKSAKTEPVKTKSAKTEPVKTELAKTEPTKTKPAKTNHNSSTIMQSIDKFTDFISKLPKNIDWLQFAQVAPFSNYKSYGYKNFRSFALDAEASGFIKTALIDNNYYLQITDKIYSPITKQSCSIQADTSGAPINNDIFIMFIKLLPVNNEWITFSSAAKLLDFKQYGYNKFKKFVLAMEEYGYIETKIDGSSCTLRKKSSTTNESSNESSNDWTNEWTSEWTNELPF